tara:strand:- start:309 stop:1430 length:1122 start_codon:yes stop_codon:yes gene_type:complete
MSVFEGYKRDISYAFERVGIQFSKVRNIRYHFNRFLFNKNKQLEFIIDFASFLKTASAFKACQAIINGVEKSNDSPLKKYVAQSIIDALDEGREVSDGMKPWFDKDALQIYKAGEIAGNIEEVIQIYAEQFEQIRTFKKDLFSGLKMPAFFTMVAITGFYSLASVDWLGFPKFKDVSLWLTPAQFAYKTSYVVHAHIDKLLLIPFIVKAYKWFVDNATFDLRFVLDRFFPLSIYKGFQALRFTKIMTVLKTARTGDFNAVSIIHDNSSRYIRHFTDQMKDRLNEGRAELGDIVDVNLLPPRLIARMYAVSKAVGDEAKIKALQIASQYAEKEIAFSLSRSKTLLTLMGWLIGAGTVGTLVIGFLLTTLSLSSL